MNSPKATNPQDLRFMRHALVLARRGLGLTAPNPAVGCVIVARGRIVGRGWTQPGGRPHAETEALSQAGELAAGATAYVTLEPCAHHGVTGPCAEALVEAGVARVVYALEDPDPRVNGGGHAILERAGVETQAGLLRDKATALNAGFLMVQTKGRPVFTLKAGMTLDGRIATSTGESKWITGERARAFGHHLRATHDAIMIGAETALADNPGLDCRLAGLEDRSPVRIVMDSDLRLPVKGKLVATAAKVPTIVIAGPDVDASRKLALEAAGVQVLQTSKKHDLEDAAHLLAGTGLTRVLVEGGGRLHSAFLKAGLADRMYLFAAPSVMGADGKAAIGDFGTEKLEQLARFRHTHSRTLGDDRLDVYERK